MAYLDYLKDSPIRSKIVGKSSCYQLIEQKIMKEKAPQPSEAPAVPENPVENQENRVLTREEVAEKLSELKKKYCLDVETELGITITFPEGVIIGGKDYSGLPLKEAISDLQAMIDTYEPPTAPIESGVKGESDIEKVEIPVWLSGHEDLIWRGSFSNPFWLPEAKQYGDKVIISYRRRAQMLKPGRSEEEQPRALESIKNTFSLGEWKIAGKIFEEYKWLENDFEGQDIEKSEKAKNTIYGIVREENRFRHGGETPQLISGRVKEVIEVVAKTTRGFKKEDIDADDLTQRIAEILSQLFVLNRTRSDGKERVPKASPDIKEFPSFSYSLSQLAVVLDRQLEDRKGLTLMTGEAGTGKNELVKYLAAKTGRPYFWFPCSRKMDPIELVTHYEFDTQEGSRKFFTDLAEGIQTPGAVVLIDEYNALNPGVQALLHGLGDSNRMLEYDGIRIPVAEDVLIVLAGNPATYGAAGDAGQALLNRTRGYSMGVDYPPLKKSELLQIKEKWSDSVREQREQEDNRLQDYVCNEALVLYPQIPELANLSEKEFELLWDLTVNETSQSARRAELSDNSKVEELLDGPQKEEVKKVLLDMRDILRVADVWRKKNTVKAGFFGLAGFSLRDSIAVTKAYARERDVRKAYLSIFEDFAKQPIDGLNNLLIALEQVINDTVGHA